MAKIEVTDGELLLIKNALLSFLTDFGHDEADLVRDIQDLLAKLAAETESNGRADMAGAAGAPA